METFLMGAIAMAWGVVSLFFLRFWRETRDRLFLIFAIAFALLGSSRLIMAAIQEPQNEHTHLYWMRLAAYLLILIAIADKNRPRSAVSDHRM
jgi:hypothetical protein